MTDLAKLVVKLEAQTAQYMAQLDKANARLAKFDKSASVSASNIAKGVATAVAGAATAFAALSFQAINTADSMDEMSEKTGIAVESLSQLEYASKIGAVSFDQLTGGLSKLAKTAVQAAQGSDTAKKAFQTIGVSVTDANGKLKSTEALLLDVAEQFSQYEDGAGKAALAQQLFGKSGVELIPFLNKGKDGIKALMQEADRLGLTITKNTAAAAGKFNDDLDKLKGSVQGLANQAASQLLPVLGTLAENFGDAATSGGAMDAAVKGLAVTLKALVTAGVVVVSVFEQLGRAIYGNAQALWSLVNRDFKGAAQAYKDTFSDIKDNVVGDLETIAKIWGDTAPAVAAAAVEMDEALKKTLVFNDEKAAEAAQKSADAALTEIKRLEEGLREQVETFGLGESAVIRYRIAQGDLSETFKEAGESAEGYKQTLIDLTDKLEKLKTEAEETEELMKSIDDSIKDDIERNRKTIEAELEAMVEVKDEMSKFEERAKENIQDILANGIEDSLERGVKDGAKGALSAFAEMLKKMAIQSAAAKIADSIFGGGGGFGGISASGGSLMAGGKDWWTTLGSIFGGSRDNGGRGQRGQAYLIGKGAQPEMFVPDTSGEFIPASAWAGRGQGVTQNIYVEGRIDQRSARQLELEASRRQRSASARLG